MQRRRVCAVVGVLSSFLVVVSISGQGAPAPQIGAPAPQIRVETMYPRHAAPGRTTVINVAVPSPDPVQSAEISPAAGVTVAG